MCVCAVEYNNHRRPASVVVVVQVVMVVVEGSVGSEELVAQVANCLTLNGNDRVGGGEADSAVTGCSEFSLKQKKAPGASAHSERTTRAETLTSTTPDGEKAREGKRVPKPFFFALHMVNQLIVFLPMCLRACMRVVFPEGKVTAVGGSFLSAAAIDSWANGGPKQSEKEMHLSASHSRKKKSSILECSLPLSTKSALEWETEEAKVHRSVSTKKLKKKKRQP